MMYKSLNPNRLRLLLRCGAFGCWSTAILCIGSAVWPTPEPQVASQPPPPVIKPAAVTQTVAQSVQWDRFIQDSQRKAVVEKPKEPPKPKTKPKPPVKPVRVPPKVTKPTRVRLGVRLLGTVTEDQNRIAIAVDKKGRIVFHKKGEELDLQPAGIRVEEITNDGIRVRYQNKIHSINIGSEMTITKSAPNNRKTSPVAKNKPSDTKTMTVVSTSRKPANKSTSKRDSDSSRDDGEDDGSKPRTGNVPKLSLRAELDMLNGS